MTGKERTRSWKVFFNAAVEKSINPVYVQKIFEILIEMSEERQRECSGEGTFLSVPARVPFFIPWKMNFLTRGSE